MQGSNLSDDVRARGLTDCPSTRSHDIWDYNGTLGGPILRDKIWFFTAHRRWGNSTQVAGIFHNATQDGVAVHARLRSAPGTPTTSSGHRASA